MPTPRLNVLRFPDVSPWQWHFFEPTLRALSAHGGPISCTSPVGLSYSELALMARSGPCWVIASDWRRALGKLASVEWERLYFSVIELRLRHYPLSTLFVKKLFHRMPRGVQFFSYSPLSYRFLKEIEGIDSARLHLLPLALPSIARIPLPETPRPVCIGTITPLVPDCNLNYFLNVAHYVHRARPKTRFLVLGGGPLQKHFERVTSDLGLRDCVSFQPFNGIHEVSHFDVFLYVPLRNDHFGPLVAAGKQGIPVLASEVPGVSEWIADGSDGYVFPVHQTKAMGEVILRLTDSEGMRRSLGAKLLASLSAKCSDEIVASYYSRLFFGTAAEAKRAAA